MLGGSHLLSCHLGLCSLAVLRRVGTCARPWLQYPHHFRYPGHPRLSLEAFASCFLLHTPHPFRWESHSCCWTLLNVTSSREPSRVPPPQVQIK